MKNLKKALSIILCLVMALSLSITVMADEVVTTHYTTKKTLRIIILLIMHKVLDFIS